MPAASLAGETGLATDLKKISTTPAFSFITPNLCDDGHDYPCTNPPSCASALADVDTFLQTWVPLITSSPAFKQNGLLEITFDESDGPQSDGSSCCGEQPGPGDSPLEITFDESDGPQSDASSCCGAQPGPGGSPGTPAPAKA
jgi:phosphatidylinositol-3-phosphatase